MMKSIRIGLFLAIVAALLLWGVCAIAETRGTCGGNLTWVLDDEGALTISGTGAMTNYDFWSTSPWGTAVKTVNIESGVTSIGYKAFYGCSNLTSVTIPDSVTSIGNYAFYDCRSLTSVTIPEGVTRIGDYAFSDCSSLTSVTIPEGVTSIGSYAFCGCKSLTSVTIPDSVTSIGFYAFCNCSMLSKVAFLGGENDPLSIDNDAFHWSYPTYYCYMFSPADEWCAQQGKTLVYLDNLDINTIRTVSLPNGFRIARGDSQIIAAFVFPEMGDSILWQSSDPSIVSVNEGVITAHAIGTATITATVGNASDSVNIGVYVTATGFELSANELWIAAKDSVQLSVAGIEPAGAEAEFTWRSSDTALANVSDNGLVTTIKPGDVTITATTESGISRSCLLHLCYPVTGIAFDPAEVTVMQGGRVALTANVTTRTQSLVNKLVTFESSDTSVATVDADGVVTGHALGTADITATAFSGVSASCIVTIINDKTLIFPDGLTAIGDEAFMNDTSLEAVIVPDGCRSIGARAFVGCANLRYIRIPAGTSVAADAFEGCDGVTIDRAE